MKKTATTEASSAANTQKSSTAPAVKRKHDATAEPQGDPSAEAKRSKGKKKQKKDKGEVAGNPGAKVPSLGKKGSHKAVAGANVHKASGKGGSAPVGAQTKPTGAAKANPSHKMSKKHMKKHKGVGAS